MTRIISIIVFLIVAVFLFKLIKYFALLFVLIGAGYLAYKFFSDSPKR